MPCLPAWQPGKGPTAATRLTSLPHSALRVQAGRRLQSASLGRRLSYYYGSSTRRLQAAPVGRGLMSYYGSYRRSL